MIPPTNACCARARWSWPNAGGATGSTGPTGPTGGFSGSLQESLLPTVGQPISLGSSSNPFQDLFLTSTGELHLGPVTISASGPLLRSSHNNPRDPVPELPTLIVEGAQEVKALSLSASYGEKPLVFKRDGIDSARLSGSLLLQGDLSFGIEDSSIPPVSITNDRGKLNLPTGTLLAGAPLSSTGSTGPTGPAGGGAASLTPGPNISISTSGESSVVGVSSPLTAQLDLGSQPITTSVTNGSLSLLLNGAGGVSVSKHSDAPSSDGYLRLEQLSAGGAADPILKMVNGSPSTEGLCLEFYKNSQAVGAPSRLGALAFYGNDSSGQKAEWGRIDVLETEARRASVMQFSTRSSSLEPLAPFLVASGASVAFGGKNLGSIQALQATSVISQTMATDASLTKRYVPTRWVKATTTPVLVPDPVLEGEEYVGVNAGVSFAIQVKPWPLSSLGFSPYCIAEFQGNYVWCGAGAIQVIDKEGAALVKLPVTGTVFCAYADAGTSRLYFGGSFSSVGGVALQNIGFLDVTNVPSPVRTGLGGSISCIIGFLSGPFRDGVLFAGALPTVNVHFPVYGDWVTVATVNGSVDTCLFEYPYVRLGGTFTEVNGVGGFQNYARVHVDTGQGYADLLFNGQVRAIATDKKYYYFGGSFTTVNEKSLSYAALCPVADFSVLKAYGSPSEAVACIYVDTNAGIWMGSASSVFFNGTAYSTSVFTEGIGIQSNGAFYSLPGSSTVYVTNQTGSGKGGYSTDTKVKDDIVFQTATPLIGPGYSSVSCPKKGASFTLKASLSPEKCWYVTSLAGGAVLPSAGTGEAIFVGGTVAEEVRLKTELKA